MDFYLIVFFQDLHFIFGQTYRSSQRARTFVKDDKTVVVFTGSGFEFISSMGKIINLTRKIIFQIDFLAMGKYTLWLVNIDFVLSVVEQTDSQINFIGIDKRSTPL